MSIRASAVIASAIASAIALVISTPIDNGLVGEPLVQCTPDSISVFFQTRNPFHGHVFAKGFSNDVGCRGDYSPIADNRISIRVPIGNCGVRRLRSVNPPGLYQSVVIVITFHPLFITKVDRAINLNCFYMEAEKFVTNAIDVSMLPTEVREIAVAMPPCRYEVLNNEPGVSIPLGTSYLTPVRYARVGQSVIHKWQCNAETVGLFCMTVHSCTVDDGLGHSVRLLDEAGCALDKYVLGNLQYVSDTMAQRESHVFKYADKAQVYFQCQITLSFKTNLQLPCPRPLCPEPTRGKRNAPNATEQLKLEVAGVTDVSNSFAVLELEESGIRDEANNVQLRGSSQVCLNAAALGLFVTLFGILATAIIVSSLIRTGRQSQCAECDGMKNVIAK